MEATQKKWLLTYILPPEVPMVLTATVNDVHQKPSFSTGDESKLSDVKRTLPEEEQIARGKTSCRRSLVFQQRA